MSHAFPMQLASRARVGHWTFIGALALAVPTVVLVTRGGDQVSTTEQVLYVPTESLPAENVYGPPILGVSDPVPDNARYVAIDLDGDGADELVAETASGNKAIVFRVRDGALLAAEVIDLLSAASPCKSELGIRGGELIAQDYAPPAYADSTCAATTVRTFHLTPSGLTVAVVDK